MRLVLSVPFGRSRSEVSAIDRRFNTHVEVQQQFGLERALVRAIAAPDPQFEYIPPRERRRLKPTGPFGAPSSAESEVVDATPRAEISRSPQGCGRRGGGATSMGGVRKAVGQSVRQVGHIGGAVRQGLNGVPEVDPWRCLIATLAVWAVAVVIARTAIA